MIRYPFFLTFPEKEIMSVGIIFILILALLLVIFTIQNAVPIDLTLFLWEFKEVPLVLALIISLIIGIIAAMIVYLPKIWKLKSTIKQQQKQISKLEENKSVKDNHPEGVEMTGEADKSFFNENEE